MNKVGVFALLEFAKQGQCCGGNIGLEKSAWPQGVRGDWFPVAELAIDR